MDRYERVNLIRQAILDAYFGRGWFNHNDAARLLGLDRNAVYRACNSMERDGETESVGSGKNLKFRALVETTIPAAEMKARADRKSKHDAPARKSEFTGHYVHNSANKPPIKNPDAMGSSGLVYGLQSSFSGVW